MLYRAPTATCRARSGWRRLAITVVLVLSGLPAGQGAAMSATSSESDIRHLVSLMTLDEKLSFVHGTSDPAHLGEAGYIPGVPRLGIPPLRLTDGPAGIRIGTNATAMPAPVALASSFDDTLAQRFGQVIGRDGRALGQDVLLAPMVNIIRVPYAGRNFETFSEDPLLSARTAAAEVKGVQSQGLIATVKHFAENNQETDRTAVDVNVDEQTLREIELPAFESAVNAGVGAVMCAYNRVGGVPACGNGLLLNSILKQEWGFQGWVMSDWDATHSTDEITTGLDQEMPDGIYFSERLKAAIQSGQIPESALDAAVIRILTQMARFGLFDSQASRPSRDVAGGARVARQIATAGAVLLRNQHNALPLRGAAASHIAVIGAAAWTPKVSGGGSSHVMPDSAAAPIDIIRQRAGRGSTVTYSPGETDIGGAAAAARAATTAIVFVGDNDTEGVDRSSLGLPESENALVSAVAKANPNTIVVLNTGSSIAMPWLSDAAAVLEMWYPGEQGAEATTALLFGDANPSGRLTQTFPTSDGATPVAGHSQRYPGVNGQVYYSEGIDVGYRWYDRNNVRPLFPFGYGLSYTTFAYDGLRVRGDRGGLLVDFTVRNTGNTAGQETSQVYLGPGRDVSQPQPVRALAGYTKAALQPGEAKHVTVRIDRRQLQYWNTGLHRWTTAAGPRSVFVGSSSADLPLSGKAPVTP